MTGQTQLQGQTGALPPYQYGAEDSGPPRGTGRRRRAIWPWVTALVALLVVGAGLIAYKTISGKGSGIPVPSVVGDKIPKAEQAIVNSGLTFLAVSHVSPTGPYNVVTSTSPQGGAFESKGTQIKLNYSVRPGAKALPDVSGMSVADAERTLAADGWTNVQQSTSLVPSVKVSNGHVVSTNPSVGIKVPPGALVLLNVSGGGKRVPSVDDLSEADAQAALQRAGLVGAVVTTPGPPGAQPGTVWQSKPGVGRVVLPGSTITIYVVPQAASPTPTVSATPSPTASASPTPNASP